MKATIETKFEQGQVVYLPTIGKNGQVIEGKVYRITAEWDRYGFRILYDVARESSKDCEYFRHNEERFVFATYEEAHAISC